MTRQAAAGANKEKGSNIATSAVEGVYGDSAGALSRGSTLLQQTGSGLNVADTPKVEPKVEPKVIEPETKPSASEEEKGLTKVYLKSGQVIEGKLIERGDDYVKIDCGGIAVTYFDEEIKK